MTWTARCQDGRDRRDPHEGMYVKRESSLKGAFSRGQSGSALRYKHPEHRQPYEPGNLRFDVWHDGWEGFRSKIWKTLRQAKCPFHQSAGATALFTHRPRWTAASKSASAVHSESWRPWSRCSFCIHDGGWPNIPIDACAKGDTVLSWIW